MNNPLSRVRARSVVVKSSFGLPVLKWNSSTPPIKIKLQRTLDTITATSNLGRIFSTGCISQLYRLMTSRSKWVVNMPAIGMSVVRLRKTLETCCSNV